LLRSLAEGFFRKKENMKTHESQEECQGRGPFCEPQPERASGQIQGEGRNPGPFTEFDALRPYLERKKQMKNQRHDNTYRQLFLSSGLSRLRTVLIALTLGFTLGSSFAGAQIFAPAPPPGFDALGATNEERAYYGYPPAPDKSHTAEYAAWARMVRAEKRRITDLTVHATNLRHNVGRGVRTSNGAGTGGGWSGYAVAAADGTYQGTYDGSNSFVLGEWVVPAAVVNENCSNASLYASQWVGFDGMGSLYPYGGSGSTDVLQAGTEIGVLQGAGGTCLTAYYQAWYEWYTPGCTGVGTPSEPCGLQTLNVTVSPGDVVFAEVWYTAAAPNGHAYFVNSTTGESQSPPFSQPPSSTPFTQYRGDSAEWIVEAPSNNGVVQNLANYGAVAMTTAFGLGATGYIYPSSSPSGSTILDISLICPPGSPASVCTSNQTISSVELDGTWFLWFYTTM
jgi:hypothetical protein